MKVGILLNNIILFNNIYHLILFNYIYYFMKVGILIK